MFRIILDIFQKFLWTIFVLIWIVVGWAVLHLIFNTFNNRW